MPTKEEIQARQEEWKKEFMKEFEKDYVPKKDFEELQNKNIKFKKNCPECGAKLMASIKPTEKKE